MEVQIRNEMKNENRKPHVFGGERKEGGEKMKMGRRNTLGIPGNYV